MKGKFTALLPAAIVFLLSAGCGMNNGSSGSTGSAGSFSSASGATVNVSVNAAGMNGMKMKMKAPLLVLYRAAGVSVNYGGPGITNGNLISFTPTSMKFTLKGAQLFENYTLSNGFGADPGKNTVDLLSSPITFDVAGSNSAQVTGFSATVPESKYGSYRGVSLQFNDTFVVSGSVTVNGAVYTFTDVPIPITGSGRMFVRPAFTVDASHPATVKLYFDTVGELLLATSNAVNNQGPTFTNLETINSAATNAWLGISKSVTILMYIGNSNPVLSRYWLQFTNAADNNWGALTNFGLKVTVLQDSDGSIAAFNAQQIFLDGYVDHGFMIFGWGLPDIFTNADGSWVIRENPGNPKVTNNSQMQFTNFRLVDHAGDFNIINPLPTNWQTNGHAYVCTNMTNY